jgi:hypothetical protein
MLIPKAQLTIDSLTATAFRRKFAFCSSFWITARFAGAFQNHTAELEVVSGSSPRIFSPERTRRICESFRLADEFCSNPIESTIATKQHFLD